MYCIFIYKLLQLTKRAGLMAIGTAVRTGTWNTRISHAVSTSPTSRSEQNNVKRTHHYNDDISKKVVNIT